ncbi:hypothetical protein AVEN_188169-1 [Araneus ventricosus]|uniref:Mariner Mos1 transposase n=1 Tax=Araneus ventricosus TaxID=182803 RepID=A0A4Y2I9J3_ARAVE|nr:hypothetical protein AVEN_188169-1 [Araneus ventricosus]
MRLQLYTRIAAFENGDCVRGVYARRAEKYCTFLVGENIFGKGYSQGNAYCSQLELFVPTNVQRKHSGLLNRRILFYHDNARPHTARLTKVQDSPPLDPFKLQAFRD